MLTFNSKKYAKNESEMTDSLFQAKAHGFYKVRKSRKTAKVAIEFFNDKHEPMALISPDAVIVTASKREDGKTVYMFGLTNASRVWLGLPEGLSERDERAMATDALAEVILQ